MKMADLPENAAHLDQSAGTCVPMFEQGGGCEGKSAFDVNSNDGAQWHGSPRETVTTKEGEKPVKGATKMQMSLGVRQAQTADLAFGWLLRLQLGSIKRALAKMELARRKMHVLDERNKARCATCMLRRRTQTGDHWQCTCEGAER